MNVKEYKRRLWDNLRVARRNLGISQIVAGERIEKANYQLADLLAMTEIIQRVEGGENEKFKMLRTGSRKNLERK